MKIIKFAIALVLIITVVFTIIVYPDLPDEVPSHWNAAGEVDGYFPKIWGAILLPLMMIGMTALFYILPRFDPLHMNYEGFKNYYEGFILAIVESNILQENSGDKTLKKLLIVKTVSGLCSSDKN